MYRALRIAIVGMMAFLLSCTSSSENRSLNAINSDWRSEFAQRLPALGHRNWIVVADSAYPAQSRDGIETIVTHDDQLIVIKEVLDQLAKAKHVRPVLYCDKELAFVAESDATGIDAYRNGLKQLCGERNYASMPHEQILEKLDGTAAQFKVLVLKTDLTLPYTSVFFELDCKYWSPEAETRLRQTMSVTPK